MVKTINKFPELNDEELKELFTDLTMSIKSNYIAVVKRYGDIITNEGIILPSGGDAGSQASIIGGHQNIFSTPLFVVKAGDNVESCKVGDRILASLHANPLFGMYRRGYLLQVIVDFEIIFVVDEEKYLALNVDNVKIALPTASEASAILAEPKAQA